MAISLPHDLTINILIHLPVKTLQRFKCTCKLWLSSIESQQFIKTHRDFQIINQRKKIFVATPIWDQNNQYRSIGTSYSLLNSSLLDNSNMETSLLYSSNLPKQYINGTKKIYYMSCCHGLVFMLLSDGSMILWNPSTTKHHEIPQYTHTDGFFKLRYYKLFEGPVYCFGHDSSADDYKILRLRREIGNGPSYVDIYSVNDKSWTTTGLLPSKYKFPEAHINTIMFKNALHFICLKVKDNGGYGMDQSILSYSLVEDKFSKYEPVVDIGCYLHPINLCVVKQNLSVSGFAVWGVNAKFEVWSIMNCEENDRTYWSKIISLWVVVPRVSDGPLIMNPTKVADNGEVLLINASMYLGYEGYFIYDTRKQQFSNREFWKCEMAFDYVETLVSPRLSTRSYIVP